MPKHTVLERLKRLLALAALIASATGCGYHFGAEGSGLPAQAKTIYVERFANHSRYTAMDDQFDRYLRMRLHSISGSNWLAIPLKPTWCSAVSWCTSPSWRLRPTR